METLLDVLFFIAIVFFAVPFLIGGCLVLRILYLEFANNKKYRKHNSNATRLYPERQES